MILVSRIVKNLLKISKKMNFVLNKSDFENSSPSPIIFEETYYHYNAGLLLEKYFLICGGLHETNLPTKFCYSSEDNLGINLEIKKN